MNFQYDPECRQINCFEEYDWASVNCIKTCNFCVLTAPDSQEDAPIFVVPNLDSKLVKSVQGLISNVNPPLNNRQKVNLAKRVKGRVEFKFKKFDAYARNQVELGNCGQMPNLEEKGVIFALDRVLSKMSKF